MNFPFLIISQKLPYALAAGCTAVLKPSEFTNGSAAVLAEILLSSGLPAGAANIVFGYGNDVGQRMVDHPGVQMVSFTGSTRVGRMIARNCGEALKKVSLELGGKNPLIVFPDCDWDSMLDAVLFGMSFNAGQCCNGSSRVLVHKDAEKKFLDDITAAVANVPLGDPLHPDSRVSALITKEHREKINDSVKTASAEGAKILVGGSVPNTPFGYYFLPTVLANVKSSSACAHEEIFGPVLSVLSFASEEEAIRLANSTSYGLSAGVWSLKLDTALDVTRKLQAGTVWVNTWMDGHAELPFGGFKMSGLGRELGRNGLEEFTEVRTVQISTGPRRYWNLVGKSSN